eukprot:377898_1
MRLVGDLELALVDLVLDGHGVLAVDGAADGDGSSEDGQNGSLHALGHGLVGDVLGDLEDLLEANVATVLDVLDLLAVTRGLLEGADQHGGGTGGDVNLGDAVLDGQAAGDLETLPLLGGLHDVLTNLLGVETEGTDLGGQGGGGGDLTSDGADDDDLLLIGVELRGHSCF